MPLASGAAAAARLTMVLASAVRALHEPPEPTRQPPARGLPWSPVFGKIESHLRMGLSIAQYAKALSVTPARLRAACLEVTGKPPARVLEDRLLLEAKRNLTYTNMTVAETAYYFGIQ